MHCKIDRLILTLTLSCSLIISQCSALACATCGCSEVCPLAAMDADQALGDKALLSNSIWGNIILKLAYSRDPEILRLLKKLRLTGNISIAGFSGIAAGTTAQGVVGMTTLNPPEGIPDSYAPGIVGLGLEAGLIMIFAGGPLVQHKYRKALKTRQTAIRAQVEQILQHLEYSQANCGGAQTQLSALVGERASRECLELWQSSHKLASAHNSSI